MRCKVGDIAIIVSVDGSQWCAPDRGRLVNVVEPGSDYSDEGDARPHWVIEAVAGGFLRWENPDGGCGVDVGVCSPDECLRPIRDPGEDAVDEMVQLTRRKRTEQAREPDPVYVGQTFYQPSPPPGFVGV